MSPCVSPFLPQEPTRPAHQQLASPPLLPSWRACTTRRYLVIFQNYARDLEAVQKLYEKHKYEPPIPRNAPPVAGNIMWARQLLRRIETPMLRFSQNKALMASKESKKIVKTYNKVAKALIEFETLWYQVCAGAANPRACSAFEPLPCRHATGAASAAWDAGSFRPHAARACTSACASPPPPQAWLRSIEHCKAGLAAPLLVQHPESSKLLVNFDKEIMQLIRETKYMQRFNIPVPEGAMMVLLQVSRGGAAPPRRVLTVAHRPTRRPRCNVLQRFLSFSLFVSFAP